MIDVRCKGCDKLLFKTEFCKIAMKCPRCKKIFEYLIINNLHLTNSYAMVDAEPTERSAPEGQQVSNA